MILMDNDYYMVLSHLDSLIFRDDKIKSTGLLLACKESLIALRDTIQSAHIVFALFSTRLTLFLDPREEAEVRKAFFDPISIHHRYLRGSFTQMLVPPHHKHVRRHWWESQDQHTLQCCAASDMG